MRILMRMGIRTERKKAKMKNGSLFDGSGGFPLAATMCGIEPVWASEIEPYPIAVTRSRFPNMKHLGSVTDIRGDEIEPVDVITFGSPCQDLSVAGKRAGLKHTENGDDETTRSGLFMEAVRIIKEMRSATNGEYPRFAVWENVPGAFSSNRGLDFRVVLEEFIRVAEPTAVMPDVPKAGWAYSDVYCGDGWSLAYRVLDAQYWGVPQRRRRIYLVADFRGQRAGKILFECEGMRGHFTQGGTAWKAVAGDAEDGAGADDRAGDGRVVVQPVPNLLLDDQGGQQINVRTDGKSPTLRAEAHGNVPAVVEQYLFENHSQDTRYKGPLEISPMLPAQLGTGGNNTPFVVEGQKVYCLQGNGIDRADTAGCNGKGWNDKTCSALRTTGHPPGVSYGVDCRNLTETPELYPTIKAKSNGGQSLNYSGAVRTRYIVRRLTPTECARLQGFPDKWGHPDAKEDFTEEEYRFWLEVRNTHAEINGKAVKEYTKEQMLKWYNNLHTDSAEYRMWGNGIALPCALYVMQGISEGLNEPRN